MSGKVKSVWESQVAWDSMIGLDESCWFGLVELTCVWRAKLVLVSLIVLGEYD